MSSRAKTVVGNVVVGRFIALLGEQCSAHYATRVATLVDLTLDGDHMDTHISTTALVRERGPHVPASMLVSGALVAMSFGAIFGLIADLQHKMNFADAWLGYVTAAAFAAGFVAQMGLARYADRGHGRAMLLVGLVLTAGACIAVGAANNVGTLFVARLVLGFGEGMYLPAVRRVVILKNPEAVGAALGRLGSAQTAGFLVGPPFAAFIADHVNLRLPFYLIGATLLALFPVVARFHVAPADEAPHPAALRTLVRNPGVRIGIYIGIGMTVSVGVYDSLWAKYLRDLGASTTFIGVSLTLFGAPIVLLASRAGKLVDRYGAARLGAIGLIGASPFIVAYGYLKNIWLIAFVACFHSTFDSAVVPASQAQVASSVSDDLIAASQGLLEGVGMLVAAGSALIAAPLYSRFGAAAVWTTLAGAVVLCAFLTLRAHTKLSRSSKSQHRKHAA